MNNFFLVENWEYCENQMRKKVSDLRKKKRKKNVIERKKGYNTTHANGFITLGSFLVNNFYTY